MQVRFIQGDQTMSRRVIRRLAIAVPMLLVGSSIAFRVSLNDFPVSRILLLALALLIPMLLAAYGSRWKKTRSQLARAGSARFFFAHGNIFRMQKALGIEPDRSISQTQF